MINHIRRAIFIHTPKTAGTSIKKFIEGFSIRGDHKNWELEKNIAGDLWDQYFKFAIVRNPWDWIYSIYSFYKMGTSVSLVDENVLPNTFEEFVLDLDKYLDILGINYTQSHFIGDELDFIGKFENLGEDFKIICEKLGLGDVPLGKVRVSRRKKNYQEVYNDEMIEIVRNKFVKDIERFGYEF